MPLSLDDVCAELLLGERLEHGEKLEIDAVLDVRPALRAVLLGVVSRVERKNLHHPPWNSVAQSLCFIPVAPSRGNPRASDDCPPG